MRKIRFLISLILTLLLCIVAVSCSGGAQGPAYENHDFSGLSFEDTEFVFGQTPKRPTLKGYPIRADVKYSENRGAMEAGVYTVTVTVSHDGYNTQTLTATMTVKQANYDMRDVSFSDKTVIYDGNEHSLEIAGELPDGVTVTYEGNGASEPGEYTVAAHFSGDGKNYNPIPDKTATLKIVKPDADDIVFEDKEYVYDGTPKSLEVAALPEGVGVEYYIDEAKGNSKTDVGTYTVTAKFTTNGAYTIPDKSATLTIKKAPYDMSGVKFTAVEFTYDGTPKSVKVTGLPGWISVEYVGNTQVSAGKYSATALFTHDDPNYYLSAEQLSTVFVIKKAVYDMSSVSFNDKTLTYNGEYQTIKLEGTLPEGVKVSYYNGDRKEVGTYEVIARFEVDLENYEPIPEMSAILTISGVDMNGVRFEDKTVTYNGSLHDISVSNLPAGVSVKYYIDGIEFAPQKNAGIYTVTAKFTSDGEFSIPDKTATLTIIKADYDMSGIALSDAVFTYDGTAKSIEITGMLPAGVRVEYTGNGQISAGKYTVTASFICEETDNYNAIEQMTASLEITKASYDMSGVAFDDKTVTYNGAVQKLEATGLPAGVSAIYSVEGSKLCQNAGKYEITVSFKGEDERNYEPIALTKTATLTIEKATYNMDGVTFGDKTVIYDGEEKSIEITGTLPQGVSVQYFIGGIEGNKKTEAGEYKITASFTASDTENYNPLAFTELHATLTITSSDINVKFNDKTVTYDKNAHTIEIEGTLPDGVSVKYYIDSDEFTPKTEAGTYKVIARFTGNEIYTNLPELQATLTIKKAVYDMSGVAFEDKTVTYDGNPHTVEIKGALPEDVSVSYEGGGKTEIGKYTVTAKFESSNPNYEPIESMSAELSIVAIDVSTIVFESAEFDYDGTAKSIVATGLPEGVSVQYFISGIEGNEKTDAGVYTVVASFTALGGFKIPDKTATLTVNKATYDMSGVELSDAVFTYDGTAKSVEITGTLPGGVSVKYYINGIEGSEKINAGTYEVTAKFTGDKNYNSIPDMTATLTVNKATYDMSGILFEDKSVVCDGREHSILISGELPSGVKVEYIGNAQTDNGVHTVTAKFKGSDNYEPIPDMTATLTITAINADSIKFENAVYTYDGEEKSIVATGLPTGVSVKYYIEDSLGNARTDAGVYEITARFTAPGGNVIPDKTATLTINKAAYDMSGVDFADAEFTYDGNEKYVKITGTLPGGVTVEYIGNGQITVGEYTITAKFTGNKNYNPIEDMTATLTVTKADYNMSGVIFEDKTVTYNGEVQFIEASGLPSGVSVKYYLDGSEFDGKTNAGIYTVIAKFTGDSVNYNIIANKTATLKIEKATYDMSGVSFLGDAVYYDGLQHSIYISGTLPDGVSVSYDGNGVSAIGEHTVTAVFAGDTKNYNSIPSMSATLKILDESTRTFTVQLIVNNESAVTITGDRKLTVAKGGNAVFKIALGSTYGLESVTEGAYNESTGELVIENVQSDIRVTFKVYELGYDRNDTVRVQINKDALDEASVSSGRPVNLGSDITFKAGDTSRNFAGWSLGNTLANGGTLLSADREFVLHVIPDIIGASSGIIKIYSNYTELNVLHYDPNGGSVNTASTNMAGNAYYTVKYVGGIVTVTLSDTYMSFAESASSFWDDGSFYRDGYVLIEYNTKPDGTGEAYSLGSKFFTGSTPDQTLYCIWAEATPSSDFTYEDVHWGYASGTDATKAPHWKEDGIRITNYTGNAKWVVIPEMIDGKYVTTIDSDAFVNKDVEVLVFNKYLIRIEDGAFKGCDNLTTLYMNDGMFYMNDAAFDAATYTNFKHFYLNATMAPRYMQNGHGDAGVFSVKFSRLLASQDKNRIIVVSGSSTYQGLGSAYLEGLFDGEYTVVNLGTTRTGTGMIFFEMLQNYTHEGDIVIYAPENHVNMFGENTMWYRSFIDTEGMYNVFRGIDISHYPSVFSAFTQYNKERRFSRAPQAYEDIAGSGIRSDKYGDYQKADKGYYRDAEKIKYIDSYFLTLNKYFKNDLDWDNVDYQTANKDYNTSPTWTDFTIYKDEVNRAIALIQATGAKVYFGFAPSDADDVVPEAQNIEWMQAYDRLITDNYEFDGLVGSSSDYVFNHQYFYDCAYHLNDYGRTWRTYQLYLDICDIIGITDKKAVDGAGTDYNGCLFEDTNDGKPIYKVDYLSN